MTTFDGFPPQAWAFLDGLAANNTSDHFDAHRHSYRQHVAAPAAAFVDAVAPALREDVHAELQADARVGRSLFRINRDTRFSHDKTPYKTHVDFLFWVGDDQPRQSPACIMRLTATTVLVGAGQIGLGGPQLQQYRSAVAGPHGAALRAGVDRAIDQGSALSEPDRVRVPSPFPQDHPNADLLRRDGFHVSHTCPHPAEIGDVRFLSWTAAELSRYRSILAWFAT